MKDLFFGSTISPNSKIYKDIRCVNSTIKDGCCVGDDCDIESTIMEEKSELGRRNLIRNSIIGRGSYTGTNTIVKNTTIGNYCSISWNVSIGGANHSMDTVSMYSDYWYNRTFGIKCEDLSCNDSNDREVHIGNDVWIAAGVNIVSGVNIGDGSVIGAGSVITKDVLPYSIVVGVPGKVIKKRFDDEIIEMLEQIQWWNWSHDYIVENIDLLRSKPTVEILKY